MEITIFFIAVGLAMDAFAVSVSNGIASYDFRLRHGMKQGIYFGAFQFFMTVLGWVLGSSVKSYIEAVDHWISFLFLVVIGLNMILESRQTKSLEARSSSMVMSCRTLTFQAIATSIDALAVGISFALLDIKIFTASFVIGVVAFFFSVGGGLLGKRLGGLFKQRAEFFGGAILIAIGVKILVEHLFFLS